MHDSEPVRSEMVDRGAPDAAGKWLAWRALTVASSLAIALSSAVIVLAPQDLPVADAGTRVAVDAARTSAATAPALAVPARRAGDAPTVVRGVGADLARQLAERLVPGGLRDAGLSVQLDPATDDEAALAMVRRGRSAFAVTTAPREAIALGDELRCETLHEVVLGFVVPDETGVRAMSGLELQRLLTGSTNAWDRLGGRGVPVQIVWTGDPLHRAALDRGPLAGRTLRADRLESRSALRITARRDEPGTLAIVDIAGWDGDLPVPIDGVRPSLDAFRTGRYPFGITLRIVFRGIDHGPVTELVAALRHATGT